MTQSIQNLRPLGMIPATALVDQEATLTKEEWLELVKLPTSLKNREDYSYTIELYETMPKYVDYSKSDSPDLVQERKFTYRGIPMNLSVKAAIIKRSDGTSSKRYPAQTEELIEEVLRKIAVEGNVEVGKTSTAGVSFSLYQLRKMLKELGHTRSLDQIKQSLEILAQSNMTLTGEYLGKKIIIVSSILQSVSIVTRDTDTTGELSKCRAEFHPLVYHSFKCGTHRLVNFKKCSSYAVNTAKRIHKRMSHNFVQAGVDIPYKISMNNLLTDFGMKVYKYPKRTFTKKIEGALNDLVDKGTLEKYEIEELTGDYRLHLYPSSEFVSEVKTANFWANVEEELRRSWRVRELPLPGIVNDE